MASSSCSRLRARSAATSGLRQTTGRLDLGEALLVEERQLERARGDQPLDLRRLERADPGDPVAVRHQLEVRLGDDPAIADDDHRAKAKARLQLPDLGRQRLVVVELTREDLDRDRPPRPVVEHELAVSEVAAREALLDPRLAGEQPIERGVEIVLVGPADVELPTERPTARASGPSRASSPA